MNRRRSCRRAGGRERRRSAYAQADGMIYRTLGKTGERVSAIGLGGHHIGLPKDPAAGVRIIRSALDRGINFLDNCWDYHESESERRMAQCVAGRLSPKGLSDD